MRCFLFLVFCFFWTNLISAQKNVIVEKVSGSVDGFASSDSACVDFISSSILSIRENSGTTIRFLGKDMQNKNLYRAVTYVPDGDKRIFFISSEGGLAEKVETYLEPGNHLAYNVFVTKIESIKIEEDKLLVLPIENTAGIFITCKSDKLLVKSETGKLVSAPVLKNGWYEFTLHFDLSSPESKQTEHTISLSMDGEVYTPFTIGKLNPKEGKSVVVIIMTSCYEQNIDHANESFRKGIYREAYFAYQRAFECNDTPEDISADEKRMKNMQILTAASEQALKKYEQAEQYASREEWEEAMQLYQDAYKLRLGILKMNPTDENCLQYQKRYEDRKKELPRVITGKIIDNVRLDVKGNNIPLANVNIVCKVYKDRDIKDKETKYKREDKEARRHLGVTNENGDFRIIVPRDEKGNYHLVVFTKDKNLMGNADGFEYIPTDGDVQEGLVIRVTPNKYKNSLF